MQSSNPFDVLYNEIREVKTLLLTIQSAPKIELEKQYYSIKEAAKILKIDYQTVRAHIIKGNIKCEQIGKFYRISHLDLMDALQSVKSLKYRR